MPLSEEKRLARFWARVDVRGPDDCWPWLGRCHRKGHGLATWHGTDTFAHRVAYRLLVGEIKEVLDHLCSNPPCCNPRHLEDVSSGENTRRQVARFGHHNSRKTHCRNGHPLEGDNLIVHLNKTTGGPHRRCRICQKDIAARKNAKVRERRRA